MGSEFRLTCDIVSPVKCGSMENVSISTSGLGHGCTFVLSVPIHQTCEAVGYETRDEDI
jgi:hypothetical protein